MSDVERQPRESTPVGFWVGLAIGAPMIIYGLRGALDALPGAQGTSALRYFVGAAVLHDLVLGPVVCVVGWFAAKALPKPMVAPVQAALVVSGLASIVALPFLRTDGATVGEPSFLSRDYGTSLVIVLVVVWVTAAAASAARIVRARRSALGAGDGPSA